MAKQSHTRPLAVALGTSFAVTLLATPLAPAQDNPFAAVEYQGRTTVAADEAEMKCGASMDMGGDAAKGEPKAGDDKCGAQHTEQAAKGGESKGGAAGAEQSGEAKCAS